MFFCGNPTDLHFYRVIQLFKTDVLFQGGHHSRFHIKPYNSSWEVCHGRPYLMCFVIVFVQMEKHPVIQSALFHLFVGGWNHQLVTGSLLSMFSCYRKNVQPIPTTVKTRCCVLLMLLIFVEQEGEAAKKKAAEEAGDFFVGRVGCWSNERGTFFGGKWWWSS